MKNNIKIPVAVQIRVDDVGWHLGADGRHVNRPSRSGIPRKHQPADYIVLNEIGKGLGVEITCSLVLGEWDKNNRLRSVPHVTYDVEGWDMASEIDMDYAEKCFDAAEKSEYLGYNVHGLMHGYYNEGKIVTECQYYPLEYDKEKGVYTNKFTKLPIDEFERQIELFYQIYNDWGFKKKIFGFACPCGCHGTPEENSDYAAVLRKFGILYWPNGWGDFDENVGVTNGIVCANGAEVEKWNAFDVDPKYLPLAIYEDTEKPITDFCFHWTNFIRWNPENNFERVGAWVDYFNKQAEVFGVMLSKNVEFAASQALYKKFAKLDVFENKCIIDFSEVDNKGQQAKKTSFI